MRRPLKLLYKSSDESSNHLANSSRTGKDQGRFKGGGQAKIIGLLHKDDSEFCVRPSCSARSLRKQSALKCVEKCVYYQF